jgi:hypothetical protein
VILVCCFRMEREKVCPDTAAMVEAVRGSALTGGNREALSTVAGRTGGPARSSAEAPVMGVERRGRAILAARVANRGFPGGAR